MVHIPKRFPRWCVVLVVIGFALSGPLNADAQRRSKNSRVKSDSATHLRQGDKYFKQRRFTDALVEYTMAHGINPQPTGLFHIARALEALGHTDSAIRMYGYYLKDAKKAMSHMVDAQQRRDRLQRGPVATPTVPPPPVRMPTPPPPVAKPVPPPIVRRPPPPPPPPAPVVVSNQGKLSLVVMPPGATISIDGQSVGKAPLRAPISLLVGKHKVTVSMPGYQTGRKTVRVTRSATTPVTIMLQAATSGSSGDRQQVGTLRVRSIPNGATVLISGRRAPHSNGDLRVRVAPGNHTVEVTHPRYRRFFRRVTVSSGQTVIVKAEGKRR